MIHVTYILTCKKSGFSKFLALQNVVFVIKNGCLSNPEICDKSQCKWEDQVSMDHARDLDFLDVSGF